MRTSEADILIVPGWSSSGEDHWQSRWERNLKTARRIEQDDWFKPRKAAWVGRIIAAAAASARPVILVAHSLGVAAAVHAAQRMPRGLVAGAFLVAPADVENAALWPETGGQTFDVAASGFAPLPLEQLPFAATLVASSNDPYCTLERARQLAGAWGAIFVEAGALGHINTASGHGPWPEGVLRFGGFLQQIAH
jgi:predicted alpha/beta hydrolase family esterase